MRTPGLPALQGASVKKNLQRQRLVTLPETVTPGDLWQIEQQGRPVSPSSTIIYPIEPGTIDDHLSAVIKRKIS